MYTAKGPHWETFDSDSLSLHCLARPWSTRLCHTSPGLPQESLEGTQAKEGAPNGPLQVATHSKSLEIIIGFVFSAGVGRTGTFITIDHVLEQVEKEGVVDIAGVINKIRTQRMKLVQTVVGTFTPSTLSVLWCQSVVLGRDGRG